MNGNKPNGKFLNLTVRSKGDDMRLSGDEFSDRAKAVKNGFDYTNNVWVKDFRIQPCGHKSKMCGCHARELANMDIRTIASRDTD
jgi:hypothetical protein